MTDVNERSSPLSSPTEFRPAEGLPLLAKAFPQTFFIDPRQVRPLKINIHHDLSAQFQAHTLPADIDSGGIKRFLRWYTRRTCYLKAVARGERRIDLTGAAVEGAIPESIRDVARHEIACRQSLKTGTAGFRKTAPANPAAAWLPWLAAAFPQTFFADPRQVKPLKVFLYRDLLRQDLTVAWPAGIDREALKAFLRWYGKRTAYLSAVARGLGRIDLTGAVVTTTIPEDLRQQARAEVQRRQANRAAQATTTAATAATAASPAPMPDPSAFSLEDLYAMAIDAKLELTLKFTTLPNATPAGAGKMAFAVKTPDGQFVTVVVSTKAWNKLVKANTDWPSWVAALSGTMGERTEKGFTLAGPGLQVFERKPKTPAEATVSQAEAPVAAPNPAPAAPSPSPSLTPPAPRAPASPVDGSPAADTATPSPTSRKSVLSLKNRQATS